MTRARLSKRCKHLVRHLKRRKLSLGELAKELSTSGAALFSLVLTLPFLLWIAFPGLSLIFGALLAVNGVNIALKKGVWIPKCLAKRTISGAFLSKALKKSTPALKIFEWACRPRIKVMQGSDLVRIASGICIALFAFLLALPYPPGTNFPPALGIALLALGLLEEDGLFTLMGYTLFVINAVLYIVLPIFGVRYLQHLF